MSSQSPATGVLTFHGLSKVTVLAAVADAVAQVPVMNFGCLPGTSVDKPLTVVASELKSAACSDEPLV